MKVKQELCLAVSAEGKATFIYDDEHAEFIQALGGSTKIERVSHVEPMANGRWAADMSPIGGPVLDHGGEGYELRQQALDAEIEFLNKKLF